MELGKLTKVNVRDYFKHEAHHFTPWLANAENLQLLSETINQELYDPQTEIAVGGFSADIICQSNDGKVLIENQLEPSDHKHLGQIFTYAAGQQAKTIVWVFTKLREEHEAAIDWLNTISTEEFNFFGLEIELWKIGDSAVAPKFNVAAKPNGWSKHERATSQNSSKVSPTGETQLAFWRALNERVDDVSQHYSARTGRPQPWQNYSIGRTGFTVTCSINIWEKWMRVQFEMLDDAEKFKFEQCFDQKEKIEAEFGEPLEWEKLEGQKGSRISIYRRNEDLENQNKWPEYHNWMITKLDRFYDVFNSRVRQL